MNDFSSALIVCLEGLRLKSYQDSGGVWTLGVGHTKGVKENDTCTYQQAVDWLKQDEAPLYTLLNKLTILQQAAYMSFGFNCGIGALSRVLNNQDTIDNPKHTTDSHGNILSGLVARRQLEMALLNVTN